MLNPKKIMTITDLRAIVEHAGFTLNTVKWGHEYHRGFILLDGVQIGRACIYKGFFQHTKWYKSAIHHHSKKIFAYEYFFSTCQWVSSNQFDSLLAAVKFEIDETYAHKINWRLDNAKPNGGKRQSLHRANPMHRLLRTVGVHV